MREHKVIILGAMGAGKTTAIRTIVPGKVVSTDVQNTEANPSKATTTVAMDYGDVELPNGDRLRLFGSPGQERFDFIWASLAKGAVGGIVLVEANQQLIASEIQRYLTILKSEDLDLPVVIGITKADQLSTLEQEQFKQQINALNYQLPLITCDVRKKDSVMMLMDALMCEIETKELLSQL